MEVKVKGTGSHSGRGYRVRREKDQQLEPSATPAPKDRAEKEQQAEDAQKQSAEWQENCRELYSESKGRGFKKEMKQGSQA